jgi:hypothetical protein
MTAPADFIRRLAASGCTWIPSTQRDEEGTAGNAVCDLVAAVEWDKWLQTRAWIFTSTSLLSFPHYGFTSEPQQVDLVPLAAGLGMAVSQGQRLLLEATCTEDVRTLGRFLQGCDERGYLQVDDLAKWSRLYIVGAASLLPGELRRSRNSSSSATLEPRSSFQESPWLHDVVPTVWVLTHCVARLLCRAGLNGPAMITMGSQKADVFDTSPSLPVTAALCWVKGRTVFADLATRRVIEVAPAIAKIFGTSLP